ncbi:MAG: response regulator, partial [Aquabacterium sp.]
CTQMLKRLGCEVRVASSALEGLRKLGEHRFDLILMDIQMPGMDGIEALTWFRRGSTTRFHFITPSQTPVVAVTANALEGDEQRFLSLGFDDYLSKPFRQSQLQKILIERTQATTDVPPPRQTTALRSTGDTQSRDEETTSPPPQASPSPELVYNEAVVNQAVPPDEPAPPPEVPPVSPSSQEEDASILDAEALKRLRELDPRGDNRLIERVASAFEASVGRLLPQLDDALRAKDQASILHVAHTLKSSSASIGALKLSQQCAEIEHMIRRQTGEDLNARLREIPLETQRVLRSLRALLESTR